jgi:YbbR domain-containing protein
MKDVYKSIVEFLSRFNFTKNTTQKMISVLFAIVFWIFVMDTENPEMTKMISRIPIDYIGVERVAERNLEIIGESSFTVDVRIRGRRKDVMSFGVNDFVATVDLSAATKGDGNFVVSVRTIRDGVIIESVSRSTLALGFDQVVNYSKPVVIDVIGELELPYVLHQVKLDLERVDIKGPERLLNRIERVVGVVDITGNTRSFTTDVVMVAVDENDDPVPDVVLTRASQSILVEILKEKQVPVLPMVTEGLPSGYVLLSAGLSQTQVTLLGPEAVIDALDGVVTTPYDLALATESVKEVAALVLPEGVVIKPGQEIYFELIIEPIERRVLQLTAADVSWLNVSDEWLVELESRYFEVIIEGAKRYMSALEAEDIKFSVDVSELTVGEHDVVLKVVLPEGVEWVKSQDEEVFLSIVITNRGLD